MVSEVPICLPFMGRTLVNLMGAENSLPFLLAGIELHLLQRVGEKWPGRPSALSIVARRL